MSSASVSNRPSVVQKKRGRQGKDAVYSLVEPVSTLSSKKDDALGSTESLSSSAPQEVNKPPITKRGSGGLQGDNLIVCLHVPRPLFQKLFGRNNDKSTAAGVSTNTNNINGVGLNNQPSSGVNQPDRVCPISPEEFMYSRLSIPDLYPEIPIKIEPDQIVFFDYQQVDLNFINQHFDQSNSQKKVSLILPTFESGWPEQSSYACWNCTEKFESSPVGLPTPHEIHGSIEYRLEGNFCSPSCAGRYLFDHCSGNDHRQRWDLLNLIYHQNQPQKLEIAPPVLSLKKFGGPLTLAQYRNSTTEGRQYNIYKFPLKPCLYLLEETRPIPTKSGNKAKEVVPLDQSRVKNIENKYKLSRKNPLPSKSASIEKCLGITLKS